jgi:hypothetical protein
MPKKTKKAIAELHGITLDQVNYAQAKGVNIWNDDEMRNHCREKPSRMTKPEIDLSGDPEKRAAQTLEEIINEVSSADDMASVKISHEKLKALKIAAQVRLAARELLPEKEVREKIIRVVAAIRSEFTKLPSELPPRISGLPEPAIQRVLRDEIYGVLERLSDETIAIFEATEQQP